MAWPTCSQGLPSLLRRLLASTYDNSGERRSAVSWGMMCGPMPCQRPLLTGSFYTASISRSRGSRRPPRPRPSAVLPPALALGEMSSSPGTRLIEAYVIGWELQGRFRRASSRCNLRGFHPPGLFGPVGTPSASARILGLDQTQTRMALGIAASHTGGLTANTGTMVKSTHPGAAARQGVEAALLAQAGFVSHDSIIEAHQGYVDVLFGAEFDWDARTRDLGTTFQLVTPGFNIKRYPAQIYMQWAIEATQTLQQRHHIQAEDVAYLELEVPAGNVRRGHEGVRSGLDGKFSFAYCGAVA